MYIYCKKLCFQENLYPPLNGVEYFSQTNSLNLSYPYSNVLSLQKTCKDIMFNREKLRNTMHILEKTKYRQKVLLVPALAMHFQGVGSLPESVRGTSP